MELIEISNLQTMDKAPENLLLRSGHEIFRKGENITQQLVDILVQEDIKVIYAVSPDDHEEFKFHARHKPLSLDSDVLANEGQLQASLYNLKEELIFKQGDIWTKNLAKQLRTEGHEYVFVALSEEKLNEIKETAISILSKFREIRGPSQGEKAQEVVENLKEEFNAIPQDSFTEEGIERLCTKVHSINPDLENSLSHQIPYKDPYEMKSESLKFETVDFHKKCVKLIDKFCQEIVAGQNPDTSKVNSMCKETIKSIVNDQNLTLSTTFLSDGPMQEYVLRQNVNRGIYSMNIATAMGFSAQQVFELSYGAFLHDIGMMKVPQEILIKKEPLTQDDKNEIFKHCAYSINMLQRISGIPEVTPIITYQCHERGDRSGYPRRLKLPALHIFSKIVMVADIYCAMVSERPYRKAFQPDQAIAYIIQEVKQGKLDKTCVAALLRIVSRYPVGSSVLLSDGRVGKVVSLSDHDPSKQIVRVIFEGDRRSEEYKTLDLAKYTDVSIVRGVDATRLKLEAMDGF